MLLLSSTAAPLQHYEKRNNMGASQRRLLAAAASLAIAASSIGSIAPAIAAPTTVTNEQVTEPTNPPTDSPAPAAESPTTTPTTAAIPTPTEESTATATASAEPVAPSAISAADPPTTQALKPETLAFEATTTAGSLFSQLTVATPSTLAYDRANFTHWIDADRDGCDTRAEVLIYESVVPATVGPGCTVTAGQWNSWYDGASWTNPSDVDIDHFVPLAEAWKSGAWAWTSEQRQAFANDLNDIRSLEAVTDSVNQSKGSKDFYEWGPALDQCRYAQQWVAVKYRWNLTIDSAEQGNLRSHLYSNCANMAIALPEKAATPAPAAPGSYTTSGAIGAKYAIASGVLGAATSHEFANQRFGGAFQLFERGTIAYLQQYGAYMVVNGINTVWQSIGAQNSDLGYPTSDEYSPMAGGVLQNFQFGKISWNPATGSRITKGGIGVTWDNAGGPLSGLGYPTTDEYSPMAGGIMQGFQYGKISWNAATGSRITKGGIGATWDQVGGPTSGLGYPTTDEYATANGGVTQGFQYGQIVWSPATGSRFIKGGIGATWIGIGGPRSILGYPTSDEIGGLAGGGAKQYFQYGELIWSPGAGSYVITGGIRAAWAGQWSEGGRLGYPTTNEYGVTGGSAQDFQGGRITWYPGSTRIEYASDAYRPAPAPAPAPTPTPAPAYYANCTAVRNAGAAPLYSWQPGYRAALDADSDGIACEG